MGPDDMSSSTKDFVGFFQEETYRPVKAMNGFK